MPSRAISSSWVPRSTISPSFKTTMRSAALTVEIRCEMISVVRFAMTSLRRVKIVSSVCVSTLAKASSRIRMLGLTSIARANAVRCFCPPEIVMPRSPKKVSKPSGNSSICANKSAVRAASLISASLASSAPNAMLFRRKSEKRYGSCETNPICDRSVLRGMSWISTPSTKIVPAVGLINPRD